MNRDELSWGFAVGATFTYWVWPWNLAIGALCAVLWAYGGMSGGYKLVRRLGVPTLIVSTAIYAGHSWWCLASIPLGYAVLCIGYGIPSTQPKDDGSVFGRFWFNLVGKKYANLLTRFIIAILLTLAFSPVWYPTHYKL